MNKKVYFLAGLAAMMLASCSSDKLDVEQSSVQQALEPGAVGFDAYTQRGLTRAGQTGAMTLDNLKKTEANGGGFGVFGYYTDNNEYEQSRIPDFMYNQGIFWNETYWTYEPIKYWPNEYGSEAVSDDADKVTFFAYAPYVETNASGKVVHENGDDLLQWGITGMSKNSAQGDPIVKYIASFEAAKSVDLLWGVVGTDAAQWALTQGGSQDLTAGYPWVNVQRPAEAATQQAAQQRVKFTFNHALTQLSMNIDAIVDEINKGENDLAAGTKIYVRQLSLTGVALKGALNLNNSETDKNKAVWLDYNGLGDIESSSSPVILYDGRKDGKEGVSGATASNEKILGFNPDIISDNGNTTAGVTKESKKVFANDPVMLIPTGEDMEIEITYDVETKDDNLATLLSDGSTHGSSIENKIRKTLKFSDYEIAGGLENGKHYTINLHLGMNSVKFDVAGVSEWVEVDAKPDVYLPSNDGGSVVSLAGAKDASLSGFAPFTGLTYENQKYTFSVKGLTANESVTGAVVSDKWIDALNTGGSDEDAKATVKLNSTNDFTGSTDNKADASGVVYVEVTLPENKTVHNLPAGNNYILIEGQTSLKGWKARFEMAAHPFDAQVVSLANGTEGDAGKDIITLGFKSGTSVNNSSLNLGENKNEVSGISNTLGYGAMSTDDPSDVANFIKVSVNGTALTYAATPSANEFSYDGANQKITIGSNLAVGDKVKIELAARNIEKNANDGATQTLEFTVGGITFAQSSVTYPFSTSAIDIQKATIVGNGTVADNGWSWSKVGTEAFFNFTGTGAVTNAEQAKIVAVKDSTTTAENVQLIATFNAPAAGSDYFYTTSSSTAKFSLSISPLGTTTTFDSPTQVITGVPTTASAEVKGTGDTKFDKAVTVTAGNNTISTAAGTDVKYSIQSQTLDDVNVNLFTITEAGELKTGETALGLAKNYKLVIRATFTKDGYVTSHADKTITVQTVGE